MKDLLLAVGQTWFNKDGWMVTVVGTRPDNRFSVLREDGGYAGNTYVVRADGVSVTYRTEQYDLVERSERVYIAGPMSGLPELNFPAFNAAAKEYRRKSCFVINPAEMNGGSNELDEVAKMTPEQYQAHWVACMKKDIAAVLTCDTVVMLPGWEKSKGATLEHHVASQLGLTITYKE